MKAHDPAIKFRQYPNILYFFEKKVNFLKNKKRYSEERVCPQKIVK